MVMSRTGPTTVQNAGFDTGVQLRLDQENAKGGVFGRKLKINNIIDDQSSGTGSTDAGNRVVNQDPVFGVFWSGGADTIFPLLKSDNVPVTGSRSSNAFSTDRNAFGATGAASTRYSTTTWSVRMKQAGTQRLAVLSMPSTGAVVGTNNIYAAVPLFGMAQVGKIQDLPASSFDATSVALRLKQAGADTIMTILTPEANVSVLQALKQQGVPMKNVFAPGFTDPGVVAKLGSAIEGVYSTTAGAVPYNAPIPAMRNFINAMKAKGQNPYTSAGPMGYAGADLFIKGLKLVGKCPTRESLISALRKVDNFTGNGILQEKISFRPGLTPNGNPPKCQWYSQVISGVLVPDPKPVCGEKFYDMDTNTLVNG